jgi:hypothetical protein
MDDSLFLDFFLRRKFVVFLLALKDELRLATVENNVVKRKRENKKKNRWPRANKKADNIVY